MANTMDIINKAMERNIGIAAQSKQLATQTALTKAEVARAGKQMEMQMEQFQAQQERVAMTDLMNGLIKLKELEVGERLAKMRTIGSGANQMDMMEFFKTLTETPDLLDHIKEGERIKTRIYDELGGPESNELFGAQVANVLNRVHNDPLTPQSIVQHEGMRRTLDKAIVSNTGKTVVPIVRRVFQSVIGGREWVIAPREDISAFIQIAPYAYGGDKELYNKGKELLNDLMSGASYSRVRKYSSIFKPSQYVQDEAIQLDRSRNHPKALRDSQNFIKNFAKEVAKKTGYSRLVGDNLDVWARTVASAWIGAEANKNIPEVIKFQELLQSVGISMQDIPVVTQKEKNVIPYIDDYRSTMYDLKSKVTAKNQRNVMLLSLLAHQSNPALAKFMGSIIGKQKLRAEEQANYNPFRIIKLKTPEETHTKATQEILDDLPLLLPGVQGRIDEIEGNEKDKALMRKVAQELAWIGTYKEYQDKDKAIMQAIKLLDYLDKLPRTGYDMYQEETITDKENFMVYKAIVDPEEGFGLKFDNSVEKNWEFLKAIQAMYGE